MRYESYRMNNLHSYFRYNRVEIDKEIEQMKKDDSYKEDADFESNYYRAIKIKVKKVIVQGKSSKYENIG